MTAHITILPSGLESDYRQTRSRQMYDDPKLIKLAVLDTSSADWSYGKEDTDILRFTALDALAEPGMTVLRRADLEAALMALDRIDDERKTEADWEDQRPSYRPPFCG